ncbi:MAG TPA: sterol desaturase family protein [Pyrinomonadaceae bacterium]|jgi:sterol desaturase/sphingolipid hydroxylase (fatty acid hydroxylase superfamily)
MSLSPKIAQQTSADSLSERALSRIAQSKSTYWFGFFTDPLTVIILVGWDALVLRSNPYAIAASFLAGFATWTLVEYCFHRWIYHQGETLAHAGHLLHHDEPEALIGMPWFLTSGVMCGLWLIFSYVLELRTAASFISGLLSGFVFYYSFHHIHHHYNPKSSWYRKLRAHHKIHHQIPAANFGVTNRFWDRVFRTTYRKTETTAKGNARGSRQKPALPPLPETAAEVKARHVSMSRT